MLSYITLYCLIIHYNTSYKVLTAYHHTNQPALIMTPSTQRWAFCVMISAECMLSCQALVHLCDDRRWILFVMISVEYFVWWYDKRWAACHDKRWLMSVVLKTTMVCISIIVLFLLAPQYIALESKMGSEPAGLIGLVNGWAPSPSLHEGRRWIEEIASWSQHTPSCQ